VHVLRSTESPAEAQLLQSSGRLRSASRALVVQEAGGEIAVESHPGLGTSVFVELPLA